MDDAGYGAGADCVFGDGRACRRGATEVPNCGASNARRSHVRAALPGAAEYAGMVAGILGFDVDVRALLERSDRGGPWRRLGHWPSDLHGLVRERPEDAQRRLPDTGPGDLSVARERSLGRGDGAHPSTINESAAAREPFATALPEWPPPPMTRSFFRIHRQSSIVPDALSHCA